MRLASRLAGAAVLALALAAAAPLRAADTRLIEFNQDRSIEITGDGSVMTTPDFAQVMLGVTTTGKDAAAAMAANARAVNELIAAIKGEGVSPADIQTSSLSVAPTFANPAAGSNTPPAISGYDVGNMVTITVREISRLGPLLDKAVGSGANAMYGIAFGQNDPSALLDKARPLAVADARRKADIYAAAAGAKIGRLMDLTEQVGSQSVPFPRRVYAANATMAPTPIETGQDKLTVSVTARYELIQ
jgi:uncharacterized protein YggE